MSPLTMTWELMQPTFVMLGSDDDGKDAIGVWSSQEPSCVCKSSA